MLGLIMWPNVTYNVVCGLHESTLDKKDVILFLWMALNKSTQASAYMSEA